ncbi:MAG: DUF1223 domain-containing protein [Sphingomonadaceae bacterium]
MIDRRSCCLTLAAGLASVASSTRPAMSQTAAPAIPRMVVELFTSQGCSLCPPADALLAELAEQPDIVALTLPVDYWDYLGWKDTLASPAHTARQKSYAIIRGDRQVYTPQAVINGVMHAVGSNRGQIERAGAYSQGRDGALTAPVSLSHADGRWIAHLPAAAGAAAQLIVMTVMKSQDVTIKRGENANRTLTYANVVRSIALLGEWNGQAHSVAIDPALIVGDHADAFVLLVQAMHAGKPGAILGAAKGAGL